MSYIYSYSRRVYVHKFTQQTNFRKLVKLKIIFKIILYILESLAIKTINQLNKLIEISQRVRKTVNRMFVKVLSRIEIYFLFVLILMSNLLFDYIAEAGME